MKKTEKKQQNVILLRSYQKTIQIKDGKLYDGENEIVDDLSTESITDLNSENPVGDKAIQRGYQLTRSFYKRLISRPFENIVVFVGAGASKSSGGPLMKDLWNDAFLPTNKKDNEEFFNSINYPVPADNSPKNIEELLSQAQKAIDTLPVAESGKVIERINAIKKLIIDKCKLSLQKTSPHQKFLNKITSRKLKYSRIKIFTLNYDTLFEQAAAEGNFVAINGFSFSQPSYFNGSFFDYDIVNRKDSRVSSEENFIAKVFHLYKPHGSINWEKSVNGRILAKNIGEACADPLMIYPNSAKYEYGYDQPFFEMMSRFQQGLRQPNTLLLCVGFEFGDKHFRNIIIESVKSNPGLDLIVVLPRFAEKEQVNDIITLSETQNNIVLIDENFQDFAEYYPFSVEYEHDDREQKQTIQ